MKPPLWIAMALALAGCATFKGHDAPGCAGPRRPANPNGSVLSTNPPPISSTPAAAGVCAGGPR